MKEIRVTGPLAREAAMRQEFYNKCHGDDGKFCSDGSGGKGGNGRLKGRFEGKNDISDQDFINSYANDPESQRAIGQMLNDRDYIEPYYSNGLAQIAERNGGDLAGFEHRFKSNESLQSRINRNLDDHSDWSTEDAIRDLGDSLRYTIRVPEENYESTVRDTLADIAGAGIEFTSVRNSWGVKDENGSYGTQYAGINSTIRDPETNLKVEIQFHTPDSYEVKSYLHPDYETLREKKASNQEMFDTWRRMQETSDSVTRPPGVENLAGNVSGVEVDNRIWPWKPDKYIKGDDEVLYYSSKRRFPDPEEGSDK